MITDKVSRGRRAGYSESLYALFGCSVFVCLGICVGLFSCLFFKFSPSLSPVMENKNLIFPSWNVRLLNNFEGFDRAKKRIFLPRAVALHVEFSICASVFYYPLLSEI